MSLLLIAARGLGAADPVFSGPQPGEKVSGFKVVALNGPGMGQERDPTAGTGTGTATDGKPLVLVFVHAIERSLVPLLRSVDEYGAARSNLLRTEIVFLSADRLEGERRVKAASGSLKLKSPVGLSIDGAEGPGNYGLNKECLMTLVAVRGSTVATNFALVQPGIVDAPRIVSALAALCGDTHPPSIESLTQRPPARAGEAGRMDAGNRGTTPEGKPKEPYPGATPTDLRMMGLLRRFIKPTNDVATVDTVLAEVRALVKEQPELRKQAVDGWTRVLHFGDRYGTAHARKVGQEFLEEMKAGMEEKSDKDAKPVRDAGR
jgi:hypothetical protein